MLELRASDGTSVLAMSAQARAALAAAQFDALASCVDRVVVAPLARIEAGRRRLDALHAGRSLPAAAPSTKLEFRPDGRPVLELGVKSLIAYLLGSVSGSLLLGRLRGVDIRELGSGNAGGTNALRTQGWQFALAVMAIDIGKAVLAVGVLPGLDLPFIGIKPRVDRHWLAVACAIAVVVGHVYPLWYDFRGGKGAATLIGAVAVLAPAALIPVLAVWLADGDADRLRRLGHDAGQRRPARVFRARAAGRCGARSVSAC